MLVRLLYLFVLLPAVWFLTFSVASADPALAGNPAFRRYTTRDGLAGDYITAVAFEPNGSAWIGTSQGVTHISDAGWVSYTRAFGLGDSFITAIAVAPDGRIWVGTQSGGVSVLNPGLKKITTYNLDNSNLPSNFVTAIAVSQDNLVWVGTLNQGLAHYDPKSDTWSRDPELGNSITAISLESDGKPLVGTPQGAWIAFGDGWASRRAGDGNVRRIDAFDGEWYLTTDEARYLLLGDTWVPDTKSGPIGDALRRGGLTDGQVTAFGKDEQQRFWVGTARGIWLVNQGNFVTPPEPLPVVLIHGWTVTGDDTLATSEFRFLKSYADRDGIPMYYARGISPKNTLFQNAQVIRDEIARVKQESKRRKVNVIAFSMGGMNIRAYLESSLYADDVNRVIILGTPQAGVEVWKPILFQQILQKPDEPSAIELSPEYARTVVNPTRLPNPGVAYDLLVGDARKQKGLDFLDNMPASDALISVHSALALDIPNDRKHVDSDLHDWSPEAVPIDLTGYLYPRDTWERYLRNPLRNPGSDAIGAEVYRDGIATPPAEYLKDDAGTVSNHTPVVNGQIVAGETVTRPVTIDANASARFISYYPGGKINFSLVAPDGKKFEPSDLPRNDDPGVLNLSTDIASFSGYVVKNATVGEWQLILKRTDKESTPLDVATYVELSAPLTLNAFSRWDTLAVGATNTITASVAMTSGEMLRDVKMTARIAQPAETLGKPYIFTNLDLFDDGQHSDGAARDGVYGNDYTPSRTGWHLVFVQAEGSGFARSSESLFAVTRGGAVLESNPSWEYKPKSGPGAETLDITTDISVTRAGRYGVAASLRTNGITPIASQFVPMELKTGMNRVTFSFDALSLLKDSRNSPQGIDLDLSLLDLDWAAVPLEISTHAARISQ